MTAWLLKATSELLPDLFQNNTFPVIHYLGLSCPHHFLHSLFTFHIEKKYNHIQKYHMNIFLSEKVFLQNEAF